MHVRILKNGSNLRHNSMNNIICSIFYISFYKMKINKYFLTHLMLDLLDHKEVHYNKIPIQVEHLCKQSKNKFR